jgi:hypothetical protein
MGKGLGRFLLCFLLAACPFYGRGPGFAPAGEFLFVRDKKEPNNASADGCPAELAAFLRHSAQTAAGNMNVFHEVMRDACARMAQNKFTYSIGHEIKNKDL